MGGSDSKSAPAKPDVKVDGPRLLKFKAPTTGAIVGDELTLNTEEYTPLNKLRSRLAAQDPATRTFAAYFIAWLVVLCVLVLKYIDH